MSKILTDNQYYYQIANVIREQNGTSNTYKPVQMVSALKNLFYEEVEGVPPISFNGIGENLLDYRIDGASGGVGERTNNLFDKNNPKMLTRLYISATGRVNVTSSNSRSIIIPCTPSTIYNVKFKYSTYTLRIASFSIYPAINKTGDNVNIVTNGTSCNSASYMTSETANYLFIFCYNVATQESRDYSIDEFFSEIMVCQSPTPLSYEPYGYNVPVVISGKNLFDEIYPNIVINTVKYISFALTNGEYTLSSNIPNGGSASLFLLAGQVNSGASTQNNGVWLNNPQTVNVIDGFLTIGYRIYGNINPEDYETILALGSTATDYEPYHEPTITNIYLNTPIGANESISLSDTNVNIPTIRGTNVLSIDTTVQPSNVYVKAREESSYEIAMREDYEEQLSDIESALQEV